MFIINKEYIVKSTLLFDQIIKSGSRKKNNFLLIYFKENNLNHARFGITVPKKLGNAVLRNKIKRQIKEIIRKNIKNYQNKDYILIVGKNFINLNFSDKINTVVEIMKEELLK